MNHTMHGIIFSYGKPTGLGDLIAHRIPGSMPFGGNYRVVDFMLSNMVNAGIHDVGVIMHGKCQSMLDHLGNGRSWDLSRNRGGLTLLPAFAYAESRNSAGRFRGKVEALGCVLEYLREIRQEYVVLADSDLVINLPLEQVLQEHIASGADLTEVCTAEPGDPSDTYLEMDEQGRIVDVAYDVHTPAGYRCLNVCILRRELLVQLVEECMAHNRYSFRHHILQDQKDRLHLHAYVWQGYAARIDTVQTYYRRSMELLDPAVRAQLFAPERPIKTKDQSNPSTYYGPDAKSVHSLVADGCFIEGEVENSILSRGVIVEAGAKVSNSVLMQGTIIRAGASLSYTITDKNVQVNQDRMLMGHSTYPLAISKDSIV